MRYINSHLGHIEQIRQKVRGGVRRLGTNQVALHVLKAVLLIGVLGCESGVDAYGDWYEAEGIIAGEETRFETWRGVLALLGGGTLCTATLVDEEVLLTAAHCVYEPQKGVNYLERPELLMVRGGANVIESGAVTYATGAQIVLHENWKGDIKDMEGVDLALIRLNRPLTELETYPIRERTSPQIGQKGKIVGYGLWEDDLGDSAGVHRQGDTTVQDLRKDRIEMGKPSGVCNGDSGGPLFTVQDGRWVLTGVTSFGMSAICLPSQGGWAVDVVRYRSWIDSALMELVGHGLEDVEGAVSTHDEGDGLGALGYGENDWGTAAEENLKEFDGRFEGDIEGQRFSQDAVSCSLSPKARANRFSPLGLAFLLW